MPIHCYVCNKLSRDHEFCDHCNTELLVAETPSQNYSTVIAVDGEMPVNIEWNSKSPPINNQYRKATQGCYRLYGFSADAWKHWEQKVGDRLGTHASYLAPIEIIQGSDESVVVAKGYGSEQIVSIPDASINRQCDWGSYLTALEAGIGPIVECLIDLSHKKCAWLNFDPSTVHVGANGIQLTNLDLQLFPFGTCPDILRVSKLYSAPEVACFAGEKIGAHTDVFQLGAWLYYLIAARTNGLSGEGLNAFEWSFPALRLYQPYIQPGISPTIERAICRNPNMRYPDIETFWSSFRESVVRVKQREASNAGCSLAAEAGSRSIAGPAKSALGRENQDSITLIERDDAMLAVVADGVSTATHGTGERASQIACELIGNQVNAIADSENVSSFKRIVISVFDQASHAIGAEAGGAVVPLGPGDVMSTTASLVLIKRSMAFIANAGDSRVYLFSHGQLESLTIDGDLATHSILNGESPEVAIAMGINGKTLTSFIGGRQLNDASLTPPALPYFGCFNVLSEEVLLICSDGLIDEGVFLEAFEVEAMLQENSTKKAQEIADYLVEQASNRQRLPSEMEPQGFGDNITCILIKLYRLSESH